MSTVREDMVARIGMRLSSLRQAARPARPGPRVVADVMGDALTVDAGAPVGEAVRLLLAHRLDGLVVVDSRGAVAGLVTPRDLMIRLARPRRSGWRTLFADPRDLARDYRRANGVCVADVMSVGSTPVGPECSLETAAVLLEADERGVLPVVDGSTVVGVVTRRDLITCLAVEAPAPAIRSDAELVDTMRACMRREPWAPGYRVTVCADGGVVSLWGLVDSMEQQAALEAMARSLPGCRGVEGHLVSRSALRGGIV